MGPKIVLATMGSLGDLHPFIAVGCALRDRGANVVLACAAEYQSKVECAGLVFHAVQPSFEQIERDLGVDRARLTQRAIARTEFLFRDIVLPYIGKGYDDMLQATADADLVLASSLAFGARLAAEKRAIPWIAVVLQPMMFLSAYDPPVLPQAEALSALLRRLGPTPARWTWWILKKVVARVFGPINRLRAGLGLAPCTKDPLFDGPFAAAGVIGLYSRLLGGIQPDYPPKTSIAGFATFDSEDGLDQSLDPELNAFLGAGAPPLVFTLGSLVVNSPGNFYRNSLAAARLLKRRAVLLIGDRPIGEFAQQTSSDIFVCGYARHSLLFPRAAAIVHHGGIGTLAQALKSGRPQLIVPHFADQPDNAARAVRLGVARQSPPRRYTRSRATRELRRLLDDARYAARAEEVGAAVAAEDGAAEAARIVLDRLERLGRK
jgi:UDP:flavonoid glycosyltransferase YjiC (YdhE family)